MLPKVSNVQRKLHRGPASGVKHKANYRLEYTYIHFATFCHVGRRGLWSLSLSLSRARALSVSLDLPPTPSFFSFPSARAPGAPDDEPDGTNETRRGFSGNLFSTAIKTESREHPCPPLALLEFHPADSK